MSHLKAPRKEAGFLKLKTAKILLCKIRLFLIRTSKGSASDSVFSS